MVGLFLVGSFLLLTLAGCGRGWFQFAEREPWRAEAELACLKSGTVREGVNIVRAEPISGPGVCGADFPLKVAALGGGGAIGFADELRPPGAIPNAISRGAPRWPLAPPQSYPSSPVYSQPSQQPYPRGAPTSPNVPASEPPDDEDDFDLPNSPAPSRAAPRQGAPTPQVHDPYARDPQPRGYPQTAPRSYPSAAQPLPTLGPARGPGVGAIGPVAVKPQATLACPMVSALDRWIADAVQPAALRWFGASVAEIKQISAYSCRGMNGNSHARVSEHAFGNALDIASFTLTDGRRISVKDGWRGLPEEQGFLRDVQGAACQQFSTVLAPGSNVYHYDHIHVDLMRRSSGRVICQPGAVSGEEIAARAGGGMSGGRYATRDPQVTGSTSRVKSALRRASQNDDDWVEDETHIR